MITEWNTTKEDYKLITQITTRVTKEIDCYPDALWVLEADLEAAHMKMPLDLERLLNSPKADFIHDIAGIRKHIDRETGELQNCFMPRCGTKKIISPIGGQTK